MVYLFFKLSFLILFIFLMSPMVPLGGMLRPYGLVFLFPFYKAKNLPKPFQNSPKSMKTSQKR